MDREEPVLIIRSSWTVSERKKIVENGKVRLLFEELASIKQLPLTLAWALSIHRSQSLSIDKLAIDFQGVFESSQVYVALSRARTLQGLQVSNFRARDLKPNAVCIEFNQRLAQLQSRIRLNAVFQMEGIWNAPEVLQHIAYDNDDNDEEDSEVEEVLPNLKRKRVEEIVE